MKQIASYLLLSPLLFFFSMWLMEAITKKFPKLKPSGDIGYYLIPLSLVMAGLGILILFV